MALTHRLVLFSFLLLNITERSHSVKVNQTDADIHDLTERRSLQRTLTKGNHRSKMRNTDRIANIARATLRKQIQDLENLRFSCQENEYYDKNTENCEDCINLCKNFSPKMCQVYCPGTQVGLKFKLPQLAGDLIALEATNEEQDQKIMGQSAEIAALKDNLDSALFYNTVCSVVWGVTVACLLTIACFFLYKKLTCRKSNESIDSDSKAEYSPSSSYNSLKRNEKACNEQQDDDARLINEGGELKTSSVQREDQLRSGLILNQISPSEEGSEERRTIASQPSRYQSQTAQLSGTTRAKQHSPSN